MSHDDDTAAASGAPPATVFRYRTEPELVDAYTENGSYLADDAAAEHEQGRATGLETLATAIEAARR